MVDNVKTDLKGMRWEDVDWTWTGRGLDWTGLDVDWTNLHEDRDKWWAVVETGKCLRGP
jgi:hypothetical protein